ncbi:DNA replication and repair protein RecF [Candidatus Microgenomates bacterium]|nr:DNA replication and repair protein RecF [Candidatus Microgenomates bacterium]
MFIQNIKLHNFRVYNDHMFKFSPTLTTIVGPNTAGKTNILEAIYLLATGKSFRALVEKAVIAHESELARIEGFITNQNGKQELTIITTNGTTNGTRTAGKRYLVNGVGKQKSNFVGEFNAVVFSPEDIQLITGSPARRRNFLDSVLIQTDRKYAHALTEYEKAIRRRNKLLYRMREENTLREDELTHWDSLVIMHGQIITKFREECISFLNNQHTPEFNFILNYDHSAISKERLLKYQQAELSAGYTLVGPHRDDIILCLNNEKSKINLDQFGSRGEQRMGVLWLKYGELKYLEHQTQEKPVLLLDDIFSELDKQHRQLIQNIIPGYQTIITTANEHYLTDIASTDMQTIRLNIKPDLND